MNQYLDLIPNNLEAIPGHGPVPARYCFVGVSPSMTRPIDRINEPFGSSTWNLFARLKGLQIPEEVYLTNLIKVPQNQKQKVTKRQIREYQPILVRELKLVKPERVLAMGTAVAQVLCPGFDSLREDHGTLFYNPEIDCLVIPTFMPAQVGYDQMKFPLFYRDLERFMTLPRPEEPPYQLIEHLHLSHEPHQRIIFDIETTGLEARQYSITRVGFKLHGEGLPLIIEAPTRDQLIETFNTIRSAKAVLVGHNVQFDLEGLTVHSGCDWSTIQAMDTMLMAHVSGEEVLALKHLSTMYTDRPGSRAFGGPSDNAYLAEDLLSTEEILDAWLKVGVHQKFAAQLLNRISTETARMRVEGVYLDQSKLRELLPIFRAEVATAQAALNALAGKTINWNSTDQVVPFLLSRGVTLTEKTKSGGYTIKEQVLLPLAKQYSEVQQLLAYRERVKELTFLEDYAKKTSVDDPYLRPRLKLAGTRTGRLSCENPNVQQVKRTGPIKTLYRSRWPSGYIGLIDLSQAELRVACLLSGDEEFAAALLSEDVHRTMASKAFHKPPEEITSSERKKSKGITFGVLYGGSAKGLASRMGITPNEVQQIMDALFGNYKRLATWIKETRQKGVDQLFIETPFGRKRDLHSIFYAKGSSDVGRKATNTPVQSTASDVALLIMDGTSTATIAKKMKSRVIFGVHDSVLSDIYPTEPEEMAYAVRASFRNLWNTPLADYPLWPHVPLTGEFIIGKSWAAVESTNENYDKDLNLIFPCSSHDESIPMGGIIAEDSEWEEDEDELDDTEDIDGTDDVTETL